VLLSGASGNVLSDLTFRRAGRGNTHDRTCERLCITKDQPDAGWTCGGTIGPHPGDLWRDAGSDHGNGAGVWGGFCTLIGPILGHIADLEFLGPQGLTFFRVADFYVERRDIATSACFDPIAGAESKWPEISRYRNPEFVQGSSRRIIARTARPKDELLTSNAAIQTGTVRAMAEFMCRGGGPRACPLLSNTVCAGC